MTSLTILLTERTPWVRIIREERLYQLETLSYNIRHLLSTTIVANTDNCRPPPPQRLLTPALPSFLYIIRAGEFIGNHLRANILYGIGANIGDNSASISAKLNTIQRHHTINRQ